MSVFQTLSAAERDRESPLTGANVTTPAGNSVMEKLREQLDYLFEVFFREPTPSSNLPITTDRITAVSVATFGTPPAPGDAFTDGLKLSQRRLDARIDPAVTLNPSSPLVFYFKIADAYDTSLIPIGCAFADLTDLTLPSTATVRSWIVWKHDGVYLRVQQPGLSVLGDTNALTAFAALWKFE